jgi:hypothetical protein
MRGGKLYGKIGTRDCMRIGGLFRNGFRNKINRFNIFKPLMKFRSI